jgi:hypothetical protein
MEEQGPPKLLQPGFSRLRAPTIVNKGESSAASSKPKAEPNASQQE